MMVAMAARPAPTWLSYCETIGDRSELFKAIAQRWQIESALYVGSYLDLAPSAAFTSVTYVDVDRRAAAFFSDDALVSSQLKGKTASSAGARVEFLQADYTSPLQLPEESFDLLISLFTVPAWRSCQRYVKRSGLLLANASHGEASLAALDPHLQLAAVIHEDGGVYRLDDHDLDGYLIPKRAEHANADFIRAQGKGIRYTKEAFAYLFSRI